MGIYHLIEAEYAGPGTDFGLDILAPVLGISLQSSSIIADDMVSAFVQWT